MIPQETVNQILDTAQIADVVSDYVTLKRRGANLVACCPFHNEKTPSFYVSPAKGIYKCFGCHKAGSAVGFVMDMEHCSYVDALRMLARKYNIEIVEKEETPEELMRRQHSESLLLVSDFAQKYFTSQLSQQGEGRSVGYAYFRNRGIEDETIRKFGLGWAPKGRASLVEAAAAAGYKVEYLIDAGLAVKYEDGSVADKFRERVMFPIHSVSGRVVAFSGRTLHAENHAKYVNSPETEIYVKSRNLLGIYFAKGEIARLDKCILVEGNVDMVMMHQLGIRNVVASCGTALTVEQIRMIHKFTSNMTIMYDGDSAGIHAALRGIDMVLAEGMDVKIVLLPDGEDPDSFARSHTLEQVQEFIAAGEKDFVVFKTDLLLSEAAGDPLKKANLINDIADTISRIPDAVKRSTYVEAISRKFGIEDGILFERIGRERRQAKEHPERERVQEEPQQPQGWVPEKPSFALAERDLLGFLITNGQDILHFEADSAYYDPAVQDQTVADFIRAALGDGTEFGNSVYRRAFGAYLELYDRQMPQEEIIRHLQDSPDRELADAVSQLSTQKYQLTVKAFAKSLTTTSSWLVTQVPKAILVYNSVRLDEQIDEIRRSLRTATEEESVSLLQQMVKIQKAQQKIKKLAGREKSVK